MNDKIQVAENIERILSEINGRARLLAATKTVPAEMINFALGCGLDLIGENRVNELLEKYEYIDRNKTELHFIGALQTNKVKYIMDKVSLIHSVDSVHLAEEISKQALNNDLICNILLEVNIGSEESKTGFDKSAFLESLSRISELPNLNVKGIMTIPPICDNEKELKNYFLKMSQYFNDIKEKGYKNFNMEILSMGMSGDYESAIECGANLVRIGSLIYGARIYK